MTEKRYTTDNGSNEDVCLVDNVIGKEFESDFDEIVDLLNEQEETIQDLLKYKYLVKALEEVSGSHYIEEIISDYTDGALSDEKEQLELGKWHSEHGLSWEDGVLDD